MFPEPEAGVVAEGCLVGGRGSGGGICQNIFSFFAPRARHALNSVLSAKAVHEKESIYKAHTVTDITGPAHVGGLEGGKVTPTPIHPTFPGPRLRPPFGICPPPTAFATDGNRPVSLLRLPPTSGISNRQ